jgi:hypothetical protein
VCELNSATVDTCRASERARESEREKAREREREGERERERASERARARARERARERVYCVHLLVWKQALASVSRLDFKFGRAYCEAPVIGGRHANLCPIPRHLLHRGLVSSIEV